MFKTVRLAIFLLVVPAVASGCGSSETASTSSATTATSASAPTPSPTTTATPTTTQSTTPTTTSTPTPTPTQTAKAPEANPIVHPTRKHPHPIEEKVAELLKRKRALERKTGKKLVKPATPTIFAESKVPLKKRYTPEIVHNFTALCTGGKGSSATCECIIVKLEVSNVEKGRSIAELLTINEALENGRTMPEITQGSVRLPRRVKGDAISCGSAGA